MHCIAAMRIPGGAGSRAMCSASVCSFVEIESYTTESPRMSVGGKYPGAFTVRAVDAPVACGGGGCPCCVGVRTTGDGVTSTHRCDPALFVLNNLVADSSACGIADPARKRALRCAVKRGSTSTVAFYHGSGARIKRRKKGEEKKEDFRRFNCSVLRGFAMGTQPTTPDRHVPKGSAPLMMMNCTVKKRPRRAFGKRPPAPRKKRQRTAGALACASSIGRKQRRSSYVLGSSELRQAIDFFSARKREFFVVVFFGVFWGVFLCFLFVCLFFVR